jgi:hypothetical protein
MPFPLATAQRGDQTVLRGSQSPSILTPRRVDDAPDQVHQTGRRHAHAEDARNGEYVDWLKAQVERMESISPDVHGDTGSQKEKSLVQAMLASGLAENA